MGACATKPKVLKEEPGKAPEPVKEEEVAAGAVPEEVVAVVEEEKKVVKREIGVGDMVKEIVDDDKVDDQGSKRRSLSHLFKQV